MNLYLIGSGFTHGVESNAPLNSALLRSLVETGDYPVFAELRQRYGTDDIEIALTRLDMDRLASSVDGAKLDGLRRDAELGLAQFFGQFTANMELLEYKPWLTTFIDECVHQGDLIVSLNYDTMLEGLLDCRHKWTPKKGYGFISQPVVEMFDSETPDSPVQVLKIHGSENFVAAPYQDNQDSRALSFRLDQARFPVSGEGKQYDYGAGQGDRYLIAPSFVKTPAVEITYLMLDALRAIDDVERFFVIGCGLRTEDAFLTVLMTALFHRSDGMHRSAYVIDPGAVAICDRIYRYWGVPVQQQVRPIIGTLEENVEQLRDVVAS